MKRGVSAFGFQLVITIQPKSCLFLKWIGPRDSVLPRIALQRIEKIPRRLQLYQKEQCFGQLAARLPGVTPLESLQCVISWHEDTGAVPVLVLLSSSQGRSLLLLGGPRVYSNYAQKKKKQHDETGEEQRNERLWSFRAQAYFRLHGYRGWNW